MSSLRGLAAFASLTTKTSEWSSEQEVRHVTMDRLEPGVKPSVRHIPRLSAVLLCMLTEVQVYFRFDGARINQRLHEIWNALLVVPEVKELHDERYAKLMKDRGITAD